MCFITGDPDLDADSPVQSLIDLLKFRKEFAAKSQEEKNQILAEQKKGLIEAGLFSSSEEFEENVAKVLLWARYKKPEP